MRTLIFFLVTCALIFVVMFVFRYKVYETKMNYRGYHAIQRMDKVTGKMEARYKGEWITEEEWKIQIDREIRRHQPTLPPETVIQYVPTASNIQTFPPSTEIPSWQTPKLSPMTGKTKPVLVTKKGVRVAGGVTIKNRPVIYEQPQYTENPDDGEYQSPQDRGHVVGQNWQENNKKQIED